MEFLGNFSVRESALDGSGLDWPVAPAAVALAVAPGDVPVAVGWSVVVSVPGVPSPGGVAPERVFDSVTGGRFPELSSSLLLAKGTWGLWALGVAGRAGR